jgi:hypothetical protein
MDESGDLGFKGLSGSSKYIIITVLLVHDLRPAKIFKYLFREIREKFRIRKNVEIKGTNSTPRVRKEVLTRLARLNIEVFAHIAEKNNIPPIFSRKNKKEYFYNLIAEIILADCILGRKKPHEDELPLMIDKRKQGKFPFYRLELKESLEKKFKKYKLKVYPLNSRNCYGLWAVDHISWSIQRREEHHDTAYYPIIEDKVRRIIRWAP